MPRARLKQAAACCIVELGRADKFVFDIGVIEAKKLPGVQQLLPAAPLDEPDLAAQLL